MITEAKWFSGRQRREDKIREETGAICFVPKVYLLSCVTHTAAVLLFLILTCYVFFTVCIKYFNKILKREPRKGNNKPEQD